MDPLGLVILDWNKDESYSLEFIKEILSRNEEDENTIIVTQYFRKVNKSKMSSVVTISKEEKK